MIDGIHPTAVLIANLAGTFAFGVSGAMAGVRRNLDSFGVMVLAAVVGLAGGVTRDVLIGIPPQTVRDWRFLVTVIAAGLLTNVAHRLLARVERPIDLLDAAGLAVFCVSGAAAGLHYELGFLESSMLGMITGIGGGIVRDVLTREIPTVLRAELYAIPALLGAAIVSGAYLLGHHAPVWPLLGAATCLVIRIAGMRFELDAPGPIGTRRASDPHS